MEVGNLFMKQTSYIKIYFFNLGIKGMYVLLQSSGLQLN